MQATVEIMKPDPLLDGKADRILALTDEEVKAEHLALYNGNEKLAQKSIDMMRAKLEALLGERWKQ